VELPGSANSRGKLIMNKVLLSSFAAVILAGASFAQASAQAEASGSASQSSAVSADKSGAQVQSQTSAQAATDSAVSSKSGNHSAQAAESSQVTSGSTVHATLVKPVDARKNKAGDEVVAKTTQDVQSNGEIIVPKGSKLIGHVTEAKARGNGEAHSAMGIAFDHAVLKNGREVPMTATIQAIASAQQSASAAMSDDGMMAEETAGGMASGGGAVATRGASTGGGLVGGAGQAVGATTGTLVNTSTGVAGGTVRGVGSGSSATGALASTSHGVIGLNGLQLSSAAANSTQGSLITSNHQNVHLDSGTQMILLVSGK
jgi:hypothetical protein